jgi:hypothetical protein
VHPFECFLRWIYGRFAPFFSLLTFSAKARRWTVKANKNLHICTIHAETCEKSLKNNFRSK